ncbi:hypothetical protein VTO42DRAFT_2359 [Malbranchea cinnamomea]
MRVTRWRLWLCLWLCVLHYICSAPGRSGHSDLTSPRGDLPCMSTLFGVPRGNTDLRSNSLNHNVSDDLTEPPSFSASRGSAQGQTCCHSEILFRARD